jgi:hypothetical protein
MQESQAADTGFTATATLPLAGLGWKIASNLSEE